MDEPTNKSYNKFLIIWCGELISSIGSGLTAFGLAVYVFQMTHSASSVALVTLCAFLPTILLSPVGGVLADRFDRRWMMILGDLCSAFGLVFLLVVMAVGQAALWQICLGVAISSVFVALLEPAYKATITDLLTKEEYAKASGLMQLAASSKYLLSPVIAGFLLGITSVKTILIIDISTFFTTVLAILYVKKNLHIVSHKEKQQHFLQELKEGWHVIVKNKGIAALVAIMAAVTFYIGFLQTLFTPMMLSFTNTKTLGTIETISACGMLFGSLFIGIFSIKRNYAAVLAAGLGCAGIFIAFVGVSTNIFFIAGAGFLFFAALPFVNTPADVLIRSHIPNEMQGRAWGMIGVISQMGYVGAYAVSGVLADRIFEPLLTKNGSLSGTVGKVIGTGAGRGIGMLLIAAGVSIVLLAVFIYKTKSVRKLEYNE
jgi:DHA3 family macrolide efflux protein-like MFS transporter